MVFPKIWLFQKLIKFDVCLLGKFILKTSYFALSNELKISGDFPVLVQAFRSLHQSVVVTRRIRTH